jgi:hypothetical protein
MMDLGLPYQWGGSGPPKDWGIDCSGEVLRARQWKGGDLCAAKLHDLSVPVEPGDEKPADLSFPIRADKRVTHVAQVVGPDHDDPRRLIVLEAGGGDQTCTTPEIARAKGACVRLVSWSRLACEVRRWNT